MSAADFVRFLETWLLWRHRPLDRSDLQDHEQALSVCFTDPYGNPLEVTTYEGAEARKALLS